MVRRIGWISLLLVVLLFPLWGTAAPGAMEDILIGGVSYPCLKEFSGEALKDLEVDAGAGGYRCRYQRGAYYYSLNPLVVSPGEGRIGETLLAPSRPVPPAR